MAAPNLIPITDFCRYHNIEISFIDSLQEYGLVTMTAGEGSFFIGEDQLEEIEQMVRLHYDLQINFEGIDAIKHLLEQIQNLQTEMQGLKNRLQFLEGKE